MQTAAPPHQALRPTSPKHTFPLDPSCTHGGQRPSLGRGAVPAPPDPQLGGGRAWALCGEPRKPAGLGSSRAETTYPSDPGPLQGWEWAGGGSALQPGPKPSEDTQILIFNVISQRGLTNYHKNTVTRLRGDIFLLWVSIKVHTYLNMCLIIRPPCQ